MSILMRFFRQWLCVHDDRFFGMLLLTESGRVVMRRCSKCGRQRREILPLSFDRQLAGMGRTV